MTWWKQIGNGAYLALALVLLSAWVLESARWGIEATAPAVGSTPVTVYAKAGSQGPAVVVAHGFAGSSTMMQAFALDLARAGYRAHVFDFLGHGRHPNPLSGDVTSVDGTTRLLIDQTKAVVQAAAGDDAKVALLGHSMATDILVRVAEEQPNIGPVVLLSAFSEAIDEETPRDLLLITGAAESWLRAFALQAVRMVDPEASEGVIAKSERVLRKSTIAPWADHVSILHSRVARTEAVAWLDRSFGRGTTASSTLPTGQALLVLIAGLLWLLVCLARLLPDKAAPLRQLTIGRLALVTVVPALLSPPLALLLDPGLLPVLVADHLALHLALYGGIQLVLLWAWGMGLGRIDALAVLFLVGASIAIGISLDRYAANFWLVAERRGILAALAFGAVLFFLADARLSYGATLAKRLAVHGAFLLSLGLAVALDFDRLFFLLMIAPVVVLFYLVFGTLGHAVGKRAGPLAPGLVLGFTLAWALGVSFPMFQP
ncbi:alpha/beta hydrolase [Ovoidimarina sediminis]|uniref:alpha/beta hydrolase n=1 Tax=Ovoidimarina sediminis TaxID=3079856 RepID=UPI002908A124|nr:alpha/beta fold hydrolase [Rhodophyticola sp. MJ-SS7]MDU8946404.1 alpha/beta fold hydrolase [Rhodophyticola sp. MJ-SS7]